MRTYFSFSIESRVSYGGTHSESIELVFRRATVGHVPTGYAFAYSPSR
jgi:hypothetical protein